MFFARYALNGRRFFFCRFSFIRKLGYNIVMKKIIQKNFFNARAIMFFAIIGFFLAILQFSTPALVDPDGYYHIKAAQIIQEKGVSELAVFPYLTKSVWQIYNADLSLGFHLILIPFISMFGGLIGIKALSIISALLVFVAFWKALRYLNMSHQLLWTTFLLLFSGTFLFRMTLPRGLIFAIISQILIFSFLSKKQYFPLFLTALAYSWIHPSAFIAILFGAAFFFMRRFFERRYDWLSIGAPLSGYFLGLLLRPDFPDIIHLLLIQDFGPLIERIQGAGLDWATELASPSLLTIASNSFLIIIIWLIGIALLLKRSTRDKAFVYATSVYSAGLISFIFFLMMLTSHRFIDFFTPFAVLFAALAAKPFFEQFDIKVFLRNNFKKHRKIAVFVSLFIILLIVKNIISAYSSVKATESLKKFQAASFWLKENTPENSVIFHTDWDDFPKLFYYNDHNRYLVGLDPTFMYEYNKDLYWLWRNISDYGIISDHPLLAEEKENYKKFQDPEAAAQTINNKFNSSVIFAPKERAALNEFLLNNPSIFQEVYNDQWVRIFRIL